MNFKRYVEASDTWVDSHYIHKTDADILTTLPDVIYVNDNNATIGLKGDMQQSGTPTPQNPIQPQECGERTGNLWDGNYENGVLNTDGTLNAPNVNYNTTMYIPTEEKNYTLSVICNYDLGLRLLRVCFYDENKNFISYVNSPGFRGEDFFYKFNFTAPVNSKYLRFSYIFKVGMSDTNIMLNTGSTALPYEKFGYKIPISSANTTTPIYLGEVATTRRIKKLVLDGTENWQFTTYPYCTFITDYLRTKRLTCVCSHLQAVSNINIGDSIAVNTCCFLVDNYAFYYKDTSFSSVTDFKTYLAQQYAAGTPVIIWYVLATPTTGIVNEPLRKIGNYADEVSGITIPTIAGANTISIGTTLQPSEVTVNYKGWHPVADVHEYDSNYTIATMQTLTIAQLQTHTISDLQGGGWS